MGAAAALPYIPWSADLLGLVPLPAIFWAWLGGFILLYCLLTHLANQWFHHRYGDAA